MKISTHITQRTTKRRSRMSLSTFSEYEDTFHSWKPIPRAEFLKLDSTAQQDYLIYACISDLNMNRFEVQNIVIHVWQSPDAIDTTVEFLEEYGFPWEEDSKRRNEAIEGLYGFIEKMMGHDMRDA